MSALLKGCWCVVVGIAWFAFAVCAFPVIVFGFPFYHIGRCLIDAKYAAADPGDMSQN